MRDFRILRFREDAKPITIFYSSKAARDKGAAKWANRDGVQVGTEAYCDPSGTGEQWDWWLDGSVEPATPEATA
jgi:hypothetical protein